MSASRDASLTSRRKRTRSPLVSVVIPTYNRAQYVAETIESVVGQTYKNLEVIVIDDGSTDNTSDIVGQFGTDVRYVRQVNSERGASRNHGLRVAKGKYIAFLDSDDLWLPRKAEEGVAFLEANPEVGLIYTDAIQIDSEGRELGLARARGPSGRVTGKLLERNFISMATNLARTAAVREIGGFREERELSGSEDFEMWVRLSLKANFAYLPTATAKVRTHAENTMGDAAAMERSMSTAAALLRQLPELKGYKRSLKRMDAQMALVNAINRCSNGDRADAIRFLRAAAQSATRIILDPRFAYTIFRLLKLK